MVATRGKKRKASPTSSNTRGSNNTGASAFVIPPRKRSPPQRFLQNTSQTPSAPRAVAVARKKSKVWDPELLYSVEVNNTNPNRPMYSYWANTRLNKQVQALPPTDQKLFKNYTASYQRYYRYSPQNKRFMYYRPDPDTRTLHPNENQSGAKAFKGTAYRLADAGNKVTKNAIADVAEEKRLLSLERQKWLKRQRTKRSFVEKKSQSRSQATTIREKRAPVKKKAPIVPPRSVPNKQLKMDQMGYFPKQRAMQEIYENLAKQLGWSVEKTKTQFNTFNVGSSVSNTMKEILILNSMKDILQEEKRNLQQHHASHKSKWFSKWRGGNEKSLKKIQKEVNIRKFKIRVIDELLRMKRGEFVT